MSFGSAMVGSSCHSLLLELLEAVLLCSSRHPNKHRPFISSRTCATEHFFRTPKRKKLRGSTHFQNLRRRSYHMHEVAASPRALLAAARRVRRTSRASQRGRRGRRASWEIYNSQSMVYATAVKTIVSISYCCKKQKTE